ncbi:MAG: hypothetical protein KBC64_07180 [Simkaniaceae bacterium]|nr:hypothetical protein [Simkaniaceae bacterium]
MTQTLSLPDTRQSAWHLSAIQLTGISSLPVLATSTLLLETVQFKNAILTLILGNILLWFIRFGILSMSHPGRKSTLDLSRDYIGHFGSYAIAFALLLSTLAWFTAQTTLASHALTFLIPINEGPNINLFIQMSVALGILSTLFCMEGIVVLRYLSVICLPLLILALIVVLWASPSVSIAPTTLPFTLIGLPLVLGTNLGVTADLPTFFRHSRSWKTSLYALTIIQIMSLLLGISALYLSSIIKPWFGIDEHSTFLYAAMPLRLALIILIGISAVCANVANVYSASVGWEVIAPILAGRKEYLILGLGLTLIFILIGDLFPMELLLNITDAALVNLCLVFILGFLLRKFSHHIPSSKLQYMYFSSWALASFLNTFQLLGWMLPGILPVLLSVIIFIFTALMAPIFSSH